MLLTPEGRTDRGRSAAGTLGGTAWPPQVTDARRRRCGCCRQHVGHLTFLSGDGRLVGKGKLEMEDVLAVKLEERPTHCVRDEELCWRCQLLVDLPAVGRASGKPCTVCVHSSAVCTSVLCVQLYVCESGVYSKDSSERLFSTCSRSVRGNSLPAQGVRGSSCPQLRLISFAP